MIERLLAWLLKGVHAGERKLAWNDPRVNAAPTGIVLKSPAFDPLGPIPPRFAGKGVGENISPALGWSNLPTGTRGLVLIMEDPDAPLPSPFVHVIATGIDPQATGLVEGALSNPAAGIQLGRNGSGRAEYAGPRSLPGHGPHRYVFQLFALGKVLDMRRPLAKRDLLMAVAGTVIGRGRLDGLFQRD